MELPDGTTRARGGWLAWHPYLRPRQVAFDLGEAARRDPRGERLHMWAAALFCAGIMGPTSVAELAGIPLIVVALCRTPFIWPTFGSFVVQPAVLALFAFVAWQACSLAWTHDRAGGIKELEPARWLWATWALWPVIAHRRTLLQALLAGAALGVLVQALNAVGQSTTLESLRWFNRPPHRHSGWWDPVVGGSLLVAVLGCCVGVALIDGPERSHVAKRTAAAVAAVATLVAIIATGTRGALVAAALLIPVASLYVAISSGRCRRALWIAGLSALVIAVAGAFVVAGGGGSRWAAARAELAAAWEGRFEGDTGTRVLMARVAVAALRQAPVRGTGAGGYRDFARRHTELSGAAERVHAHAHSAPLHIAATLGLVGLALAGAAVVTALAARPITPGQIGLLGLVLAGITDVVQLNAQTAGLFCVLLVFGLASRPPPTQQPPSIRGW
jgi:O-antigen ligase